MSKSTRKTVPSDSSSSSEEGGDGYEHDDFVVPDDYVDPVSDTESAQTKRRRKHRLRLRHTRRQGTELDPEDLELVAASQQIKAKDKDALEEALFSGAPAEPDKSPVKKKKRDESDSDDDFIEPEDGEILEGAVEAGKGQVSTALSIFGATAIYTPKEQPIPQPAFEPSDIISRFATSEDDVVRVTDIPERMQNHFARRMHPTEAELEAETDWLLKKIVVNKASDNFQSVKTKLREFLQLYRVEKFEVPYIATYRLHLLAPELVESDLWDLYRWDLDWAFLSEQKTKLAETLAAASKVAKDQALGRPPDVGQKVLITGSVPDEVTALLTRSSPEEFIIELSDLTQFCDIFVYTVKETGGSKRVVSRKQFMTDARRNRFDELATKIAISPTQLVDNIKAGKKLHWPPRSTQKMQELAFEYMTGDYAEEFRVLHTVCMLMKSELAATPAFRAFVRREYQGMMRIVTTPTERGKQALDIFHPAYRVKHLGHGKPIETFSGDLWAEVVKCEADGLVHAEMKMPWAEAKDDRILAKLKPFYISEEPEDSDSDWNNFRSEVLRHALAEIYESFATETRKVLMYRAEEFILKESRNKYAEMLAKPAFSRADDPGPVRIFAFVADPSTAKFGQVALAALDSEGEVLDTALFTALIKNDKETFTQVDDDRHKTEKRNLQQMILAQRPDVMVVAANCLHSLQLRKVVAASARLMSEGFTESEVEWKVDQTTLLQRMPPVFMGDLHVPKLFAESHRGRRMFPDFSVLLRQAVSLGRMVQSPISEVLGLWMDPNENLTPMLKLHRLQKLIPEKQLLEALEEEAVKAASLYGADLNRMFDHPHLRAPLNFVAGLGPTKAHSVFERMVRTGHVFLRTELLTRQLVTKLVYQNCAGFVVIKAADKSDPLDRTRIHPEHYDLAKKIAASALENARDEDESNVEKAMAAPAMVREVDLDNYAAYLETRGRKNMKDILELIVREFAQPFHVKEEPFQDMSGEDALYNTSGESPLTLRRGLMVQGYITSNSEGRIRCRLESGLDASVFADDAEAEKLKVGLNIRGRLLEVRVNVKDPETMFFNLKMSVRPEDLKDHVKFKEDIMCNYRLDEAAFIVDDGDWADKSLMEDEHQLGQKYVPRVVSHPKYRNVGLKTACIELETKDVGDFLLRPSSRGTDHLTCTVKFFDYVFCHLDIIEEGKPADNMLGTRFKIGDEAYESLQEIVERYVIPVSALTKEAIIHHKFKDTTGHGLEYLELMLKSEKKAAPSSIPYYFTISAHYPQFLVLCYMPKDRVIREFIKVKPKGLFFHECYHPNINFLISWFKKHYADATYQGQLARSKPPVITTENKFAIPGKVLAEVQQVPVAEESVKTPERPADTSLRHTPGFGDKTPFNKTPHIGNQEWAGGAPLKQTPRADDWEAERNFESFVTQSEQKPPPEQKAPESFTKPQALKPIEPAGGNWNSGESAGGWGPPAAQTSVRAPASASDAWGAAPAPASSSADAWGPAPSQDAGWSATPSQAPTSQQSSSSWGGSTAAAQSAPAAGADPWGGSLGSSTIAPPAASGDAWGSSSGSGGAWGSGGTQPATTGGDSQGGGGSWGSSTATAGGGSWGSSTATAGGGSWGSAASSTGGSWGGGASGGGDRGRGGRGRGCFKCGEEGHMSRDCTKAGAGGGGKGCFKCGEEGHMSRDCPKGGGKGCFNCGKEGHMSKDCTEERKPRPGGGGKGCFKCGEEGHMSKDCPKGGGKGCFNCGKEGHMSKDCTEERKPRPGGGGKGCFNCGKEGHMSKDCTEERKPRPGGGGGRSCFNCGKDGHMSKDCTEERRPRGDGRGRGRRGGGEMHSSGGGWSGGGTSSGWGGASSESSGWSNAQPSSGGWGSSQPASSGGGWNQPAASSSTSTTSFDSAWGGASAGADPWASATPAATPAAADPWAATPAAAPSAASDPWAATPAAAPSAASDPWAATPAAAPSAASDPWGGNAKPAEPQPPAAQPAAADPWGGGGWGT